jgi:nucleoid-associated protein YgaU
MRPGISRFAGSGRLAGVTVAALVFSVLSACGGGGGGGAGTQATPATTSAPASPVASPQRPALASPATVASPAVPESSPTAASNEQTYEIQSGDTLLSIAEQFYGDPTQWRRIYDANRDVIGNNPDALKVGTTLKIPPKES